MFEIDGIKWVKMIYPDSSESIFKATTDETILNRFNVSTLKYREIYNMNSGKVVYVPDNVLLEIYDEKPEFKDYLNEFANRFI